LISTAQLLRRNVSADAHVFSGLGIKVHHVGTDLDGMKNW